MSKIWQMYHIRIKIKKQKEILLIVISILDAKIEENKLVKKNKKTKKIGIGFLISKKKGFLINENKIDKNRNTIQGLVKLG